MPCLDIAEASNYSPRMAGRQRAERGFPASNDAASERHSRCAMAGRPEGLHYNCSNTSERV